MFLKYTIDSCEGYRQWCHPQGSGGSLFSYNIPISFTNTGYIMSTNASNAGAGYTYTGGIISISEIRLHSDGPGIREFQCLIIGV